MSADIHALEIEFAKSPNLDACIPLCHAYLAQQRFMEAMVVCKKGMKSSPSDPRGRIMLSQVYIQQGKMPKANQELTKLLAEHPGSARGMELMGRVLIEQGDKPAAIQQLQVALQTDPTLTEAPGLLQQLGAPLPAANPAPAAPASNPPAAPAPGAPSAPAPNPSAAPPTGALSQPAPGATMPPSMPPGGQPQAPPITPAAVQPPLGATPPPQATSTAPQGASAATPAPTSQSAPGGQPSAQMPNDGDALDVAGTWADPDGGKKLEHVNDFFAPDTLGFSNDGSHIETAGPGRLTILGFVPKSSGSIKKTIVVFLVALLAFVGWVFYQIYNSDLVKKKDALFEKIDVAIEEDTYFRYHDALQSIDAVKTLDATDPKALSIEAYVYGVLAMDHAEDGALAKAKSSLAAAEAAIEQENEYSVAASAMIAYLEGRFDEGVAELAAILDRGGRHIFIQLENYRLRNQIQPEDDKTKIAFREVLDLSSNEARALSFLGWHYYGEEDYARADAKFDAALKDSKNHTRSLIGVTLVDLDRGIGLDERQKELEKNVKKVFALPQDEISSRDLALAHFARAQLLQWQGKPAEAKLDFDKAYEIDPENPLFDYRRGMQLLKQGSARDALVFLKKAATKDPENMSVISQLTKAQVDAKDYEAALATLKRAKELAPDRKALTLLEGEVLRGKREYSKARELYETVTQKDGGNLLADALIGISATYREAGDGAKAVSFMQDQLEDAPKGVGKPTEARMWEEMGRGFEAIRNKDGAAQAYQVCIDTFSQYADCHCRLATTKGRGSEAVQAAKACVRVDPRGKLAGSVRRILR